MSAPAAASTLASASNAFPAWVAMSSPITRPFSSSDIWPPVNTRLPALTACEEPGEAPPRWPRGTIRSIFMSQPPSIRPGASSATGSAPGIGANHL